MPRRKTLAGQLRTAIAKAEQRGVTRADIARRANIGRSTLTQFLNGEGQLRLDVAERIADAIDRKMVLT